MSTFPSSIPANTDTPRQKAECSNNVCMRLTPGHPLRPLPRSYQAFMRCARKFLLRQLKAVWHKICRPQGRIFLAPIAPRTSLHFGRGAQRRCPSSSEHYAFNRAPGHFPEASIPFLAVVHQRVTGAPHQKPKLSELAQRPKKNPRNGGFTLFFWCRHQESNSGPTDYKSVALPTELCRRRWGILTGYARGGGLTLELRDSRIAMR